MLVWLNGAFGAGKTHTAFELARRLEGAHVSDPELIGYGVHRMLPPAARHDFQDRPQWRSAVLATLLDVAWEHDGPVLVPMTLVRPAYVAEVLGGLRDGGVDLRHVVLEASPETLRHRLRSRSGHVLAALGRREYWAIGRIDGCVAALADPDLDGGAAIRVPTDGRGLDEVVEAVAAAVGLPLVTDRLGRPRALARRLQVGIRHLRP